MTSLIKYELLKVWKRPIVLLAMISIVMIHILYITTNDFRFYTQEIKPYYQRYEGVMSEEWREQITTEHQEYINNPAHQMNDAEFNEHAKLYGWSEKKTESLKNDPVSRLKEEVVYSHAYNTLNSAYYATTYQQQIEASMNAVIDYYQQMYPSMSADVVTDAYSDLLQNSDRFSFALDNGYIMLQDTLGLMLRSFVILMIIVLATIFTSEQSLQTMETLLTTKYGHHKTNYSKLIAAIISGIFGWLLIVSIAAITIAFTFGFAGGNAFIQDFLFNSCPYNLNSFEYTLCLLVISLLGAICVSALIAMISSVVNKDNTSISIVIVIMLILPFFNSYAPKWIADILFYHPANIISADYLVSFLHITKVFNYHIPSIYLIFFVMIGYMLASIIMIKYKNNMNFILENKVAGE